jgi:hypothetical protein
LYVFRQDGLDIFQRLAEGEETVNVSIPWLVKVGFAVGVFDLLIPFLILIEMIFPDLVQSL